MYCIGHLSDLHVTPVGGFRPDKLLNKRFWGWLSWQLRRRKTHRPEVLAALLEDLRESAPDHLVVTGDLTNVALEHEFARARGWLERLGTARDVTIVPGNHDAYVDVPRAAGWDQWSEFLASDEGSGAAAGFPSVRVRGPVAVLGVCSALPTPAFRASGTVGAAQLERLEKQLTALGEAKRCRIVLIHHPVTDGAVSPRRQLTDAGSLREVLRRAGAELVLHGHGHRTLIGAVEGPAAPIPVVGVRSSTDVGHKEHKRAQYHVYAIEPADDGYRITLHIRGYDPATRRFRAEGGRSLTS